MAKEGSNDRFRNQRQGVSGSWRSCKLFGLIGLVFLSEPCTYYDILLYSIDFILFYPTTRTTLLVLLADNPLLLSVRSSPLHPHLLAQRPEVLDQKFQK